MFPETTKQRGGKRRKTKVKKGNTFKKNWHEKPWKTLWTCHTFCLGPFLKELGLKSIEKNRF